MYGELVASSTKYIENLADRVVKVRIDDNVVVYVGCLRDLLLCCSESQCNVVLTGVTAPVETSLERFDVRRRDKDEQRFREVGSDLFRSFVLDVEQHVPAGVEDWLY